MKVLYAAPFDHGSGYSKAATQYVHSLRAAGVDVVCRRLHLGGGGEPDPLVLALEQRPLDGVTHVVQHSLPPHFEYDARVKNVGLFAWETDALPRAWARRLAHMDAVVCINQEQANVARKALPDADLYVVPHACDPDVYAKQYPVHPSLLPFKMSGEFVFYGVGEWVRRKNWAALIRAFHAEFSPNEPVRLAIKTSMPGLSPRDAKEKIEAFCRDVYSGLRLGHESRRKGVLILTDRLSDEEMLQIHQGGDCYVSTSYGEAFGLGALDAMGMGRPVVVTDCGGYREYVTEDCGDFLPARTEPCFGAVDAPQGLYSGKSNWLSVDITFLQLLLRKRFEEKDRGKTMGQNGASRVHDFSYEAVGALFKDVLASV